MGASATLRRRMRPIFGSPFKKSVLAAAVALTGGALADATPANADVSVGVEVAPEITVAEPEEVMVTTEPPDPVYEERLDVPGPGYVWVGGSWAWTGAEWGWYPGRWRWHPRAACTSSPTTTVSGQTSSSYADTGAAQMRRDVTTAASESGSPQPCGRWTIGGASRCTRAKGRRRDRHAARRLLRARDRARSASPARRRPVLPSGPARDASGAPTAPE
jgi:hypothetical protein